MGVHPRTGSLDLCDSGHVGSKALADFLHRNPEMAHIQAIFITHSESMVIISTLPLPPNAVRC